MDNLILYIAGTVAAMLVGGGFAWAAATSERYAAPRRAKAPQDRTLTDKLIIEADRQIDLFDVQQWETFVASFVAAHLDTIIKTAPVIGPLATAADYVDDALEAFSRRNPALAARTKPSAKTMQEKLAGAIGQVAKGAIVQKAQDDGWRAPHVPVQP